MSECKPRNPARLAVALFLAVAAAPLPATGDNPAPSRIAFHTLMFGALPQIAIISPDGSAFTRLTYTTAYDQCPAVSPDGRSIAFESTRAGGVLHLFVMDADGSNQRRITTWSNDEAHPAWSRDGTQIGFTSVVGATTDVFAVNADGSNIRQLTTDPADDMAPDWSPDGSRILFMSRRDGRPEAYVMNSDGSEQRRLLHKAGQTYFARWSPDGTRIAYVTEDPVSLHAVVHVMNADTTADVAVTDTTVDCSGPSWSPDGSRIVFTCTRGDSTALYTMAPDGSDVRLVTTAGAFDYGPAWGPAPLDAQIRVEADVARYDATIRWNPSPWTDVLRYDVYRSPLAQAQSPGLVGSVTDTTWTDSGVPGAWYYRVRAVRAADQSLYSNEVTAQVCVRTASTFAGGGSGVAAVAGDFDADGIADLAVANGLTTGTVSILLGQGGGGVGDGTFATRVSYAAGTMPAALAAADFDEDGITDLAVANDATSGTVSILRGQGDGTFAAPASFATGSRPSALATADVNEDGITDLLIVHRAGNTVTVALGQGSGGIGNGNFVISASYGLASTPVAIATADFNHDGITDLAVVSSTGGQASILLGQGGDGVGDGTFAAAVRYLVAPGACALATGDFDEDGATDLAVPLGAARTQVAILRGRGDGTFFTRALYPAGGAPVAIRALDATGDGVTDLVVANSTGQAVSFLPGLASDGIGNGTFGVPLGITLGTIPVSLALGDFLEDGRPDLVTTHQSGTATVTLLPEPCTSDASTGVTLLAPDGGEHWAVGSEQTISWQRGRGVAAVDLAVSRDNGQDWETVATHLTADHFHWTVTDPPSDGVTARVRVFDPAAPSRGDVSAAPFRIGGSVAVDPPPAAPGLRLEGAFPCPATTTLSVAFSLPDESPARLELLDIAGRVLERREVGALGAGRHVVSLARAATPGNGVYFVRLSRGGRHLVARAVVLH